jgi:transposase
MITGSLYQALQLYRLCKFADDTTILKTIFPDIAPKEYFDDRLGDTLDALKKYGLGNLELLITQHMIEVFQIISDICHNDTTSASVYGNYKNTGSNNSINITYGYSKKHRQDLKQLVWSLSVSSDHAFPLFQKAYSGNKADVDTYLEQWHNLIDLLGNSDFLYVADSKIITIDDMVHINDNDGYFLAPAPMYETYKNVFHDALGSHISEVLLPYKKKINRGFEVPLTIKYQEGEEDEKEYTFRMIIIFDHGLLAIKKRTLNKRIEKTKAAFDELKGKLNKYKLNTKPAIDEACLSILEKYHTSELFEYMIQNDPIIFYKNKNRGRPPKNKPVEKVKVVKDNFNVTLNFIDNVYQEALYRCGYYPIVTNKPAKSFNIEDAMMAHKKQYKSEHTYRRAKSELKLEPIYLQKPERIESYLFLFKIALQVIVLIERTARQNIELRDKGLNNFMPNRKDVKNPRTEYLLSEFQYIVSGQIMIPDGQTCHFVSELNELQKDILSILGVPIECFTYEYLFDSS